MQRARESFVFGFEETWIAGDAEETSELLGAADIQSLVDLLNSYSVVRETRIVHFTLEWLHGSFAAPAAVRFERRRSAEQIAAALPGVYCRAMAIRTASSGETR
jgi:hypothetical protein